MKTIKRKLRRNGYFYTTLRNTSAGCVQDTICSNAVERILGCKPARITVLATTVKPRGKWIKARRAAANYVTVPGVGSNKLVMNVVRDSLNRLNVANGDTFWFKFQIDKS